jgi:hypothetical protein
MVVGRSGSGKSSLVYAGLVPALRRARDEFWSVLALRPGPEPLRALASAFNPKMDYEGSARYAEKISEETERLRLGNPELLSMMIREELDRSEGRPDRLLLYMDQWEELYAQAPSPNVSKDQSDRHSADVNCFIDLLLDEARTRPISVVASVRADFYDPLISHQKLRGLLPMQQILLGAMSRAELESTIVEPAKMAGLTFDPPQLVSRILDEAGEDEAMLPLLQYALREAWERREGNVITADSYVRSGGVREAIRLTAERTFDELSSDDQQAARKLFLRLVTPVGGQEDTAARAAMPDEPAIRKIVDRFAGPRTRLLVTGSDGAGRPTVEVTHAALLRTWPRLRQWIDEVREKLRSRALVLRAQYEWELSARREDMLLPAGLQLERAQALIAQPDEVSTDDIRAFVTLSTELERARLAQRLEIERRLTEAERERDLADLKAREAANILLIARRVRVPVYAVLLFSLLGFAAWFVYDARWTAVSVTSLLLVLFVQRVLLQEIPLMQRILTSANGLFEARLDELPQARLYLRLSFRLKPVLAKANVTFSRLNEAVSLPNTPSLMPGSRYLRDGWT